MVNPLASFVVALGTDGRILSQGSLSDALEKDFHLIEVDAEKSTQSETETPDEDTPKTENKKGGNLIVEEEVAIGRVGWSACE